MSSQANPSVLPISIASVEDLARLSPPGLKPVSVEVQLIFADLDQPLQREIERELSGTLSACGCGEGAATSLLYLLGLLVSVLTGSGPSSVFQWCLTVVGFCLTAMAGKLVGIGVARVRLSRQIRLALNLIAAETRKGRCDK